MKNIEAATVTQRTTLQLMTEHGRGRFTAATHAVLNWQKFIQIQNVVAQTQMLIHCCHATPVKKHYVNYYVTLYKDESIVVIYIKWAKCFRH